MANANHTIDSTPSPPKAWGDTPEAVLTALPDEHLRNSLSLLNCVLLRAHAVVMLLSSELEDDDRNPLSDQVLTLALWDVAGNLEIAHSLIPNLEKREQNIGRLVPG